MKMKKIYAFVAAGMLSGAVQAAPWVGTLNTTTAANVVDAVNEVAGSELIGGDGILQNVTGIDWHANGAGYVQGFDLGGAGHSVGDTDTFTLSTQFFAGGIASSTTTPDLRIATPGAAIGTYEYTSIAMINEFATVTSVDGIGQVTGLTIATINGGTFEIFFDDSPDANPLTGAGYSDGVSIVSGTIDSGLSSFTANAPIPTPGALGVGGGTVRGTVTAVDLGFVNPAMIGTEVGTTLNFPGTPGTFTRPTTINGLAVGPDTATDFVLQTDAFQSFTVPEPSSIVLMGLGLLGFGFSYRSKLSK